MVLFALLLITLFSGLVYASSISGDKKAGYYTVMTILVVLGFILTILLS